MPVYENLLEMIGHTPLMRVTQFDTGLCELYLKLEMYNPGGSVKDRIGMAMIIGAQKRGDLKPGMPIVEATAGNTGIALALVAKRMGFELVLVVPNKMSQEKIDNLRAMGAEVITTRSDVGPGHPEYFQDRARTLAKERDGFFINQFENTDNAAAHEQTTAPEIWQQMGEKLDAVIVGVGSGGTVTGLSHYFARIAPNVEIVVADPKGSVVAEWILNKRVVEPGNWLVEGVGEKRIPKACDLSRVHKAYIVEDKESFLMARELLAREGILAGPSTGCLFAAALRYCHEQKSPKRVVTFACDTGARYLSKLFNDQWMKQQGFL